LKPFGHQGNTVKTLGQHRPNATLFKKENLRFLESLLHSSLSGRPQLASERHLEKFESESILVFFSLYIEASWHALFTEFSIEFFRA
jgi:hypothetical protein